VIRSVSIAGLLLCLAACTAPTSPDSASCTIEKVADLPARLVEGAVLVPAELNHMPVQMEVDTGASASTVTPGFANTWRLPPDPHRQTTVHGIGGDVVTSNTLVTSFELGQQMWSGESFTTAPLARSFIEDPPVAGLLGADYLSDFDVELDLPRRVMTLWQVHGCAGDFALRDVPHRSITLHRGSPARMIIPVAIDGQPISALIDWGANETVLKEAVALRLGVTPEMLAADPIGHDTGSDSNVVTSHLHLFQTLRVGDDLFYPVRIAVAPIHAADVDMLLGLDYARTRHLWLSYATGQIFVVPQAPETAPIAANQSQGE
jgi:hypothetical protein